MAVDRQEPSSGSISTDFNNPIYGENGFPPVLRHAFLLQCMLTALYLRVLQHGASHVLQKAWGLNIDDSSEEATAILGSLNFPNYSRIGL